MNKEGLLNTIVSLTNKQLEGKQIPVMSMKRTHRLSRRDNQTDFIDSVIKNFKTSREITGLSGSESEDTSTTVRGGAEAEEQTMSSGEASDEDDDLQLRRYLKRLDGCPESAVQGTGWSNFQEVFMVSALNDDGVDDLRVGIFMKTVTVDTLTFFYYTSI